MNQSGPEDKSNKRSIVRVPEDVLNKLRGIMPELQEVSEADLVRIALRKFIHDAEESARKLPPEQAERFFKLLEDNYQKKVGEAQIRKSGN